MPIASITKLMTAMVILDSKLPLEERITIIKADRDLLRLTGSRLRLGASLSRGELTHCGLDGIGKPGRQRTGAYLPRRERTLRCAHEPEGRKPGDD